MTLEVVRREVGVLQDVVDEGSEPVGSTEPGERHVRRSDGRLGREFGAFVGTAQGGQIVGGVFGQRGRSGVRAVGVAGE